MRGTTFTLALLVLGASGLAARERTAELAWDELAPLIVERKIAVPLGGKMKVEGEALAVRPDGILMDIRKTSDSKAFPKGQGLIPRDSVTQVRMIREQGPWKLVGGILGTVGGALAVGGIGYATCGAGVLPAMLLIWPTAGAGGYYAGKTADRRTTLITIRAPEAVR